MLGVELLGDGVVGMMSPIRRGQSYATFTGIGIDALHVLVRHGLGSTGRRLIDRGSIPLVVGRRRWLLRLWCGLRVVPALHRISLLSRPVVLRVLVLWRVGVVLATGDEPPVIAKWSETFAQTALGVEVGDEEDQDNKSKDQGHNRIAYAHTGLVVMSARRTATQRDINIHHSTRSHRYRSCRMIHHRQIRHRTAVC